MYIRIYQVKEGEPCAFRPLSEVKKADPAVYMQVWDGRVEAKDLEKVFTIFNISHPEGYKGRSMSVSDVVGIMDDGTDEWTYYFVDTIGFTVVPFEPAATDNPINETHQPKPSSFVEQNAQKIFDSYDFEPITLFRDKKIYGFYTNDRVYEQLPEGLSKYEFRHGDTEYFSSIEKTVKVKKIGTNAFAFCSSLETVDFSAVLNLKTIEKKAFYQSELKTVIIPECVETIGENAFTGTKVEKIIIPKTVKRICYRAFLNCKSLKKVYCEGNTELDEGVFYSCESLEEIVLPSTGLIPKDTCCYCRALKKTVIPEGVTMLGVSAFAYCSSLDNIILPDSLRIISAHAFLYNTSLKTINLGTCHVESININAFGDIAAKSLLLPRTLTGQSQFPIVSDCKVTTFEVNDDNPYFCSADGVIFSKDMTVLLQYPPGKSGRYSVPDTVKR